LAVLDLDLVAIQWSRRRPGLDVAFFVENGIVAGAEELFVIGDPTDAAAQVGANVREGNKFSPVVRQNVNGDFPFVYDPAGLGLNLELE
jgi:hypothetical protein